ncbi:MAG TPA: D-alanyl-D-alanine carboxypeptidase family protein [Mobilitalea sp.]|nr:D-alanyl-D-alanine carboxypeptidase family protein [Mobilitalea sp.]
MINIKFKVDMKFLIAAMIALIFSLINYNSIKNYYNMTLPKFIPNKVNFEEKLKKENINAQENSQNAQENSDTSSKLKLNALAALLLDAENDRVLFEVNGYKELPMASTTKIMTCIIALEKGKMDDVVNISSYAASMPDVQLNIREGEQYYLKDLLYALMLESHNDVAVAIAEHIGGSVEGFATMMNDKARSLNCNNTNFVTPSGLDAEGHYTTARDLAVIASYAIKNKDFIAITNTASHQFKELKYGRSFSVTNKNKFLYMMDGAIGVKTGFTGKAGYCFVGAIKRPDRTLVSVVLGCGWPPNKNLKWTETKRIMTYGLENFEKKQIFEDKKFNPVYVEDGQTEFVGLKISGDLNLLLGKDEKVHIEYNLPEYLTAPVIKGQQVGSAKYYINGNLYTEIPIYTTDESKKIDFNFCLIKIIKLWSLQYDKK